MIHRFIIVILVMLWLAGLMGCNTLRGFGEDLQQLGESIQDVAD